MLEQHTNKMNCDSTETNDIPISIGKIEENTQITATDTGWSEEQKERMRSFGYDGLDMIRAWYN